MEHYDLLPPEYPPLTLCQQCGTYELCDGFGKDKTLGHHFSYCKEKKTDINNLWKNIYGKRKILLS